MQNDDNRQCVDKEKKKVVSVSNQDQFYVEEDRDTYGGIIKELYTHESSSPMVQNENKFGCDHTQQFDIEELKGRKDVCDYSTCFF